jgi:hypothetical protein
VNKQDNVSAAPRPDPVPLIASSLSGWRDSSLLCLRQWPCKCGGDAVVERSLCRPSEQCECRPSPCSLSLSLSSPHLSQYGATPLFWACYKGDVNVAEMLLSRGASVDHQDNVSAAPRPVPVSVSLMASSLSGWMDSSLLCLLQWPCECGGVTLVERSLCRPSEQCECRPSPCPCPCPSHRLISLRMDGLLSSGPAPLAILRSFAVCSRAEPTASTRIKFV